MKSKLPKEKITIEKPAKVGKRVEQWEKEEVEEIEGEPVEPKKKKKTSAMVGIRHGRVINRVISKGKNIGKSRKSIYQAMLDEGYSESYARSGQIKNTLSWEKRIEKTLHDDKLSNIHSQILVAKKLDYMLFTAEIPDQDIYELLESVNCMAKKIVHGIQGTHVWFWSPDNRTRKDALELAYKIKGKMSPEKFEVERTGLQTLSDEELMALINRQKARFNKTD